MHLNPPLVGMDSVGHRISVKENKCIQDLLFAILEEWGVKQMCSTACEQNMVRNFSVRACETAHMIFPPQTDFKFCYHTAQLAQWNEIILRKDQPPTPFFCQNVFSHKPVVGPFNLVTFKFCKMTHN